MLENALQSFKNHAEIEEGYQQTLNHCLGEPESIPQAGGCVL